MKSYDEQSNLAYTRGVLITEPKFSHEICGENFFEAGLLCPRLSTKEDYVPITISERLLSLHNIKVGDEITLFGQFRSYNKIIDGKSKLLLTMFAREILENDYSKNSNIIFLSGHVCKEPIYRVTPFEREIADILIAVNRSYNKSDYIPCIAWGRNARFCKHITVGEKLTVFGRIQSRKYIKKLDEENSKELMAFELSLSKIGIGENASNLAEEANWLFEDTSEINTLSPITI